MDEQQTEAWEHLAGEVPPGFDGSDFDTGARRASQVGFTWGRWEKAAGITRRAYASHVALDRVREMAEAKTRSPLHISTFNETETGEWRVRVEAQHPDGWEDYADEHGPTLCDAAWAAIQAMTSSPEGETD